MKKSAAQVSRLKIVAVAGGTNRRSRAIQVLAAFRSWSVIMGTLAVVEDAVRWAMRGGDSNWTKTNAKGWSAGAEVHQIARW